MTPRKLFSRNLHTILISKPSAPAEGTSPARSKSSCGSEGVGCCVSEERRQNANNINFESQFKEGEEEGDVPHSHGEGAPHRGAGDGARGEETTARVKLSPSSGVRGKETNSETKGSWQKVGDRSRGAGT
jgi:hypothetical protein